MDTAIEVGFNTSGNSVSGDPEGKMTDPENPDTTPGDLAPVTHEGESDEPPNEYRNLLDHYDDGQPGQYLPGEVKGRYTKVDKNFSVPSSSGDVEGVRVSFILGAGDPYLGKAKSDLVTLKEIVDGELAPSALRFFHVVATFYSFIDFAYMADGTKIVTVWDASRYPAHALYVGGDYKRENTFRESIEWDEVGWVHAQDAFFKFGLDADVNPAATPFDQGGHFLYDDNWGTVPGFRTGYGEHPVMEFTEQGSALTGVENEFQDPMFPEFPLI